MLVDTFRSAYRALRAAKGLSLAAILSIALGIGGNVTIFSLLNAVVLKPLDYPEPDRLVAVSEHVPSNIRVDMGIAPIQFLQWRKDLRSFESLAVATKESANLTEAGEPESLGAVRISAGFFETLRVRPQLGRWFYQWEEPRTAPNVVILSDALWRRKFSADPSIVGRKIVLNGSPHEVVGVTEPDLWLFAGRQLNAENDLPERAEVFIPLHFREREERGEPANGYLAIGRLKPGVTPEQARAELQVTTPNFLYENNERINFQITVEPLRSRLAAPARKPLSVLLAAVGFVLLIVCVNVANLLLVRAAGRRREFAIRAALGAGRSRLVAESLAESLLLSAAGLGIGLLLAWWIMPLVVRWAPADVARIDRAAIDRQVLLFAALLTLFTSLLFGLLPAWRASIFSPAAFLQSAGRASTEGKRGGRLRNVLVAFEAALATLLLIGAGMFLLSFQRVLRAPKGFDSQNVLSVDILLPPLRYPNYPTQAAFFRRVRESFASVPGVAGVAAISNVPLDIEGNFGPAVREGTEQVPISEHPTVLWPSVSEEYFSVMNVPLLQGRLFRDEGETERVAVVSAAAARYLWPDQNPIGRKLHHWYAPKDNWLRVVGVVGDVRSRGLDHDAPPIVYRPFSQRAYPWFSVVLRTRRDLGEMRAVIRDQVWSVDSEVPVSAFRTMAGIVSQSVAGRRMQAGLTAVFAAVAMLLAAIGVYGVVAYSVVKRRREIAVRMALGADRTHIRSLIFRHGLFPVLIGVACGIGAAAVATPFIRALLFDVGAFDPLAFTAAPLLLLLAGLLPCLRAGQDAARTDPSLALQAE